MSLRVVMMGTGTFALPAFQALIDSDHQVAGLVTQPDRTGRGHHRHVNEIKQLALDRGIDIFQPEKVNQTESLDRLREFQADLFVVAAYGQILSGDLLEIPRLGAINLHGSLLPKYRGAAPVQYAVLNGEMESGVTIFRIQPKLDAGPILGVVKTDIGPKETSGQLHDRLAELSAALTLKVLSEMESETIQEIIQDPAQVTLAPKIRKEQGQIDWSKSAREIGWHICGMQPWPMPFTFLHSQARDDSMQGTLRVLILDADRVDDKNGSTFASASPGEIQVVDSRIFVQTGDVPIEVNVLQPAGKRQMLAADFLRGNDLTGAFFGGEDNLRPDA